MALRKCLPLGARRSTRTLSVGPRWFSGQRSPTDKLAEELAPLARLPRAEFLAGLAGKRDLLLSTQLPVAVHGANAHVCSPGWCWAAGAADVRAGKMPDGSFAWVLVPIGADAGVEPLASLRATPSGVLFGAAVCLRRQSIAVCETGYMDRYERLL